MIKINDSIVREDLTKKDDIWLFEELKKIDIKMKELIETGKNSDVHFDACKHYKNNIQDVLDNRTYGAS
jgi:hypothetical protein